MDPQITHWTDETSGLSAVLVIDTPSLGQAAGGIRTRTYPSFAFAVADARRLARSMTLKCALAGLPTGGCKIVVHATANLDRPLAFAELGRRIEALNGAVYSAGDLGTSADDLQAAGAHTRFVDTDERSLADAVARGVLRCVETCSRRHGGTGPSNMRIGIQGCGHVGGAVARTLAAAGAQMIVSDIDDPRAAHLASEIAGEVVPADKILSQDLDVLIPCAVGSVIDETTAPQLHTRAVVAAANDVLHHPRFARVMFKRGILFVPSIVASAGAVIEGIGRSVMDLADRTPLIDRLGEVADEVLERARTHDTDSLQAAETMAIDLLSKRDG